MNEDKIFQKLIKHDGKLVDHGKKLDKHGALLVDHGKKLDKHGALLVDHGKKLDKHGIILTEHGKRLDLIVGKLVDHDERLDRIEENMATKQDIFSINNTLDKSMVILQRLDQERTFTIEWVRRIEGDVERIKTHLHLT